MANPVGYQNPWYAPTQGVGSLARALSEGPLIDARAKQMAGQNELLRQQALTEAQQQGYLRSGAGVRDEEAALMNLRSTLAGSLTGDPVLDAPARARLPFTIGTNPLQAEQAYRERSLYGFTNPDQKSARAALDMSGPDQTAILAALVRAVAGTLDPYTGETTPGTQFMQNFGRQVLGQGFDGGLAPGQGMLQTPNGMGAGLGGTTPGVAPPGLPQGQGMRVDPATPPPVAQAPTGSALPSLADTLRFHGGLLPTLAAGVKGVGGDIADFATDKASGLMELINLLTGRGSVPGQQGDTIEPALPLNTNLRTNPAAVGETIRLPNGITVTRGK